MDIGVRRWRCFKCRPLSALLQEGIKEGVFGVGVLAPWVDKLDGAELGQLILAPLVPAKYEEEYQKEYLPCFSKDHVDTMA